MFSLSGGGRSLLFGYLYATGCAGGALGGLLESFLRCIRFGGRFLLNERTGYGAPVDGIFVKDYNMICLCLSRGKTLYGFCTDRTV